MRQQWLRWYLSECLITKSITNGNFNICCWADYKISHYSEAYIVLVIIDCACIWDFGRFTSGDCGVCLSWGCCVGYRAVWVLVSGTQQIVSVNYLFGRSLIPSDFLSRIVTSNFLDMTNLMSVVCELLKCRSAIIFAKAIKPEVFKKWTKSAYKFENTHVLMFP